MISRSRFRHVCALALGVLGLSTAAFAGTVRVQKSINNATYTNVGDFTTTNGSVGLTIPDNIGNDIVTFRIFDLDPVAGVPDDSVNTISLTGTVGNGEVRILFAKQVRNFPTTIYPIDQSFDLDEGLLNLGTANQPIIIFASPAMAAQSRVAAAISGDMLGNLTAGRITRVQAAGRTGPGGSILGGNISGNINSTQRDETLYFWQFNESDHALAIGRVIAATSISGDIEALTPAEFNPAVIDQNTASIDQVQIIRLSYPNPLPAEIKLTGDIKALAGKIQSIQTVGPIAPRADRGRNPEITAGNSIWELRTLERNPSDNGLTSVIASVKANNISGPRYYVGDADLPTKERVIRKMYVSGEFSGSIETNNVAAATYPYGGTGYGIYVGGAISGPVDIKDSVLGASIVASTFTNPITIGTFMKGAVVANGAEGHIPSIEIGINPIGDLWPDIRRGFLGSIANPCIPVDDPTLNSSGLPTSEPNSLIRAKTIGNLALYAAETSSGKTNTPRLEAQKIVHCNVGKMGCLTVWSGQLELDSSGNAVNYENDYAEIDFFTSECMGRDSQLWIKNCPSIEIAGNMYGRIHLPELPASSTIIIGKSLWPNDTVSCSDLGNETTAISYELSPRGENSFFYPLGLGWIEPGTIRIMSPTGLKGQIILNASNTVPATVENGESYPWDAWTGHVVLNGMAENPDDRIDIHKSAANSMYKAPFYEAPSAMLGGGAIGVVPFRLYETDCIPQHKVRTTNPASLDPSYNFVTSGDFAAMNDNSAVPVELRFYGPVSLAGANTIIECAPESIIEVCNTSWQPATSAFTIRAPGTFGINKRSLGLSRLPNPNPGFEYPSVAQGIYRVKSPIKCDVPGSPLASFWRVCATFDRSYYFRVAQGASHTGDCDGDFNGDSRISVQDIFDFLNAWFSGSICLNPTTEVINGNTFYVAPCWKGADINNSGDIGVQDIFDFLNSWFSGC